MTSLLYPSEPVIGDDAPARHIEPPRGYGRGLDYSTKGLGFGSVAQPFPEELLIPESDWQGMIQEMESTKTRISDLLDACGWKPKNQQQTEYCWVNAPTFCVEVTRLKQNESPVVLSPASVGAQITNYRNVGGFTKGALDWIATHGIAPASAWPANAISRQYATQDNLALAQRYRQNDWFVLDLSNMAQIISCLLRRIPVAAGLSWWRHEVTYIDPVWVDGAIGVRFENSWGEQYGAKGRGVLQGRRMYPDDACAPYTALAAA